MKCFDRRRTLPMKRPAVTLPVVPVVAFCGACCVTCCVILMGAVRMGAVRAPDFIAFIPTLVKPLATRPPNTGFRGSR